MMKPLEQRTEDEKTLAKALLEIGGECIGTTTPAEYAKMTLDEVYPGRHPRTVVLPKDHPNGA